jgi:hypothetical protein
MRFVLLLPLFVSACAAPVQQSSAALSTRAPAAATVASGTPDARATDTAANLQALAVLATVQAQGRPAPAPTESAQSRLGTVVALATQLASIPAAAPTPTPLRFPTLPLTIKDGSGTPVYDIVELAPRDSTVGRARGFVSVRVPDSFGQDQLEQVVADASHRTFDLYPAAKAVTVWAFTRSRSNGWTAQGQVSRDGRDWGDLKADNGKIHFIYSPLNAAGADLDLEP